jgi:hypothetical protein
MQEYDHLAMLYNAFMLQWVDHCVRLFGGPEAAKPHFAPAGGLGRGVSL